MNNELTASTRPSLAESVPQRMRELPLGKPPGVAETLDWAAALVALHRDHLDAGALELTLGAVLKLREDQLLARATLERLAAP